MSGRPAIEAISDDYVRSAIEQISPTSPHPPALRAPSPHAEPPEEDLLTARTEPTSAVERLPILSARSVSGTASERSACAPSAAASGRGRKKKPPPVVPRLGLCAPREEVDALFDSFDQDGSGEIGQRELQKILRRDVKAERKKVKQVEEALEEAASGESLRVEIRAGLEALIP